MQVKKKRPSKFSIFIFHLDLILDAVESKKTKQENAMKS